ncbi:hypothetical protein HPO96_30225 [Kribbella sandramycini]|uniref:Uncharacterized protein n=1 Tax=Kribbella sandramycini TaxID=60450 RepID=A0A7Y4L741_9ACTN|nr:hypothetical protein [Kribbella sandramycini]MBB6566808.1 hypothetical protein [Kribbella sandramycini]NOL44531.1 hypothetical protein [Kribbella sandramycini]
MNLSDTAILVADDLSDSERTLLARTATPAATLLGAVSMILRTTLFSADPAAWVDMWQARPDLARIEWMDGPELSEVVAHLAAKDYEGQIEGVPGLRITSCNDHTADMLWLGAATPVELQLTRQLS